MCVKTEWLNYLFFCCKKEKTRVKKTGFLLVKVIELLVIGYSLMVIGYSLMVIRYWLLENR
jgi:hypothetical protein